MDDGLGKGCKALCCLMMLRDKIDRLKLKTATPHPTHPTPSPANHAHQVRGLCSNYLCDRKPGDELVMTGPAGTVMLLPDDHMDTDIVVVSTGTGIAPFRSFWRRLFYDGVPGQPGGYKGTFTHYCGFSNTDSILYGERSIVWLAVGCVGAWDRCANGNSPRRQPPTHTDLGC